MTSKRTGPQQRLCTAPFPARGRIAASWEFIELSSDKLKVAAVSRPMSIGESSGTELGAEILFSRSRGLVGSGTAP